MWGRFTDTSTAIIGIGYKVQTGENRLMTSQARCIAAQSGEPNLNRFMVGTIGLQEQNKVPENLSG